MRLTRFFVLTILLISTQYAQTKASRDSLIDQGVKAIYSLQFTQAETIFRSVLTDDPESPESRFFLAMIDWWKILVDLDNESYDDIFFQKLEDVIYYCDKRLDNNPRDTEALFFKGGAIGFRGRLRALRASWLKAADDGREALPIVSAVAELDPSNKDVDLGRGIYNYLASVIPERYPLIKPLMIFFPSGNKEEGLRQLENTAANGRYAKYEAMYFLVTIYQNYEDNPYKAEEFAKRLTDEFPENPVFLKWRGRAAVRRGDTQLWSEIFTGLYNGADAGKFGFTEVVKRESAYYLGLYYKNLNAPDSALKYLNVSEELSRKLDNEPTGYLANTLLFQGMVYDVLGRREEAIAKYEEVLDIDEFNGSHNAAKIYINIPFKY